MGGRSRRKSPVKNKTESRFSFSVIKRIQKKDLKNGPQNNSFFVDFLANFGLQNGPQNQGATYMTAFVGGRSRRKSAVKNNTESRFSS